MVDARSVYGTVRGDDKMSTCLRVAALSLRSHFAEGGSAKAGNAADLPAVAGGLLHIHIIFEEKGEEGRPDKEIRRCATARNLDVTESRPFEDSQNQEQKPHPFSRHAEG